MCVKYDVLNLIKWWCSFCASSCVVSFRCESQRKANKSTYWAFIRTFKKEKRKKELFAFSFNFTEINPVEVSVNVTNKLLRTEISHKQASCLSKLLKSVITQHSFGETDTHLLLIKQLCHMYLLTELIDTCCKCEQQVHNGAVIVRCWIPKVHVEKTK